MGIWSNSFHNEGSPYTSIKKRHWVKFVPTEKEEEVVKIHPRAMFIPQEGWTFVAAGKLHKIKCNELVLFPLIQVWTSLNSCWIFIHLIRSYILRNVRGYHFMTSCGDITSYAHFGAQCWDTVTLGKLLRWMLGDEWPWQCVTLLHKQTDKTRVTRRTAAGLGWGLYIHTSQCCPSRTVMATAPPGQVSFIHSLNVPNFTFQSGTTVWMSQPHCSAKKKVQLGGVSN